MNNIQEHNNKFNLNGCNIEIRGYSKGGNATYFWIPQWKIMLDAGIPSAYTPKHIFITHSHSDHTWGLPNVLTNTTNCLTIYVPEGTKSLYDNFILSAMQLTNNNIEFKKSDTDKIYKIVEVNENSEISIDNKNLIVKTVRTFHDVPSYGYAFFGKRRRVKHEYIGQNIKELKNANINPIEIVFVPLLVYTGDTNQKCINDVIFQTYKFPVVMMECTFIKSLETKPRKENNDHIEWNEICDYVVTNRETTFVLFHFSSMYEINELKNFFGKYDNVHIWI